MIYFQQFLLGGFMVSYPVKLENIVLHIFSGYVRKP